MNLSFEILGNLSRGFSIRWILAPLNGSSCSNMMSYLPVIQRCHTSEWFVSNAETSPAIHINESRQTYQWFVPRICIGRVMHAYHWAAVMSNTYSMSYACHARHGCFMPHTWMRRVAHIVQAFPYNSLLAHWWVMLRARMTHAHCNTLQYTATHCNTLHHTATHYNTLQHTAAHCNTLQHTHVAHTHNSFFGQTRLVPHSCVSHVTHMNEAC